MKVNGIIIKGRGKGRILGFPTINIALNKKIKSGVYAGSVAINNKLYKAGIFVSRDEKRLEAHIIGFKGNLRGEIIEVEIKERLRDVMKFGSGKELVKQIKKDINTIISGFPLSRE